MDKQERREIWYSNLRVQDFDGWSIWITYGVLNELTGQYVSRSELYQIPNSKVKETLVKVFDDKRITEYIKINLIKGLCEKVKDDYNN